MMMIADDADFNDEEEHVHAGRGLNAPFMLIAVFTAMKIRIQTQPDLRDEFCTSCRQRCTQQAGNKT